MPMGVGIWYNPRTDKVFNFGSFNTHDIWLRSADNRIALGLRPATIEYIESLPSTADSVDEIRLAAIQDGMVRIRDYGNVCSVQFKARRGMRDLLIKIKDVIGRICEPSSMIKIHNLATNESTELTLSDMIQRLRDDSPILFRESYDSVVTDVPFDPALNMLIGNRIKKIESEQRMRTTIEGISDQL